MKAENIYPITTVTWPDGSVTEYISTQHMELYTPPIKFREFMQWMEGQTCAADGFFVGDVEKWLRNQERKSNA